MALLTFVVSAILLLPTNDSVPRVQAPQPAPVAAILPIQVGEPLPWRREFFVRREQVVPLGAQTLTVPILMYHYVRTPPSIRWDPLGFKLSVSPQDFGVQMSWLDANGFHPVDFNDIRAYFAGTRPLPPQPVIITLDDGYKDLYTAAFPILSAHHFKAVAYIVSNFVDRHDYVTRAQVIELDRGGIQIASHTVDHADLARSSYGTVVFQVTQSKQWLEQLVGHPVLDFAYPSGKFTAQAIAAVKQAGYDTAVTTLTSTLHSQADRYTWARVRVSGGETLAMFIGNLGPEMKVTTITTVDVQPVPPGAAMSGHPG
jgi:peptidoglycan/xylan/chitin deacetylase (PgdA/CDA1 family)